jgi:DNA repair protein RadC
LTTVYRGNVSTSLVRVGELFRDAGRLLDVPVLDHLVIGHDAYVSMRDRGVAFDRPGRPAPAA